MKRIISLLSTLVIFIFACASPAVSTPTVQVESTSTSQPVESTATSASTFTPEPTITPTPVPPSLHWYWGVDSDTLKVIAVNQLGDRKEIGELSQADYLHARATSLDDERALLFLDNDDTLRVYLLTPDGMQKIKLPSEPVYFDTELSQFSRAVVAVHADSAVFTYTTMDSSQSMSMGAVDTGPIFLVDLKSLTAALIDNEVSLDPYDANRTWFRTSQDGRYLRYLNGNADAEKIEIRELDLVTGAARTINTNQGPPTRVHASPEGDLWYPDSANLILDLNGNQMDFADEAQMFTPLKDGKGLVYDWDCVDNCELNVITPFGNDAALTYNLPWTIEGSTSYVNVRQVLPDQSLLFAGMSYSALSNIPAIVETYPEMTQLDIPLFRLTPDGQTRLVGFYIEGDFTSNVSPNGQFILMKPTDKTSFFIYDAVADRPLFDMPINPDLEDPLVTIKFFDNGMLADSSASEPGTKNNVYHNFYYLYDFKTSTALNWEDVNAEINTCPDLLEDGTLVCWFYRTDGDNFDLVRFDPASGTKTTLLENVWLIDSTR
ncbi:MAG: hypothetical protein HOP27_15665 [Anaerolineales bacterium]|nr:hypothetical protein [Anaerolineales bacterium]